MLKTAARDNIVRLIVKSLASDARVNALFLTGSLAKKNATYFSDIDLWVVLAEESGINTLSKELQIIFQRFGVLLGVYECTAHHFFIVYRNGIQIDLNLVTAAQYWSLLQSQSHKKVLFDRHLLIGKRAGDQKVARQRQIEHLLLVGSTTLERGVSKFMKKDYYVVVRFLDAVRQNSLLPLIPFFEKTKLAHAAQLDLDGISGEVRELFILSYAKPTYESCRESLVSTGRLVRLFAERARAARFVKKADAIIKSVGAKKNLSQ